MPLIKITYPFTIDGTFQHLFKGSCPDHWKQAAARNSSALVGRAKDGLQVMLSCQRCGAPTLKRISVVLSHSANQKIVAKGAVNG